MIANVLASDPTLADDAAWAEALGRSIKVIRTDLGISRRQLANLSSISYSYLSAIESGTKVPSSKILRVIAERLGLQTHELHAAAEMRLARTRGPEDGTVDVDAALIDAQEQRFRERQLLRAGLASPEASAPAGAEELISLIARLDAADVEALTVVARRLAGENG
jgi:transcriptional regulator with XRE-family HTH domain